LPTESFEIITVQKLSVKNIILIAVAVAIIVVAFIVSRYENPTYAVSADNTQNSMQLSVITADVTSSTDAISYAGNWEKTLSTAVSGPWENSSSSTTASSTPLSPTEKFGQDLFSLYSQAENSGEDVTDPTVQQAIVGKVLADGSVLPAPKPYTISDLKISPDNSIAALTAYGNAAGLVYVENYIQHQGELTIVQNSLDSNDPTILKQLDPIIAEYQGMLKGELAVTVPSSMEDFHLDLVNAFNELIFADQGFEETYSDGLTSLNGLNIYQQGANDLDTALAGIKTRLNLSNITYTAQEPGIIFTYKSQ
jgi:hypothetical protein